VHACLIEDTFCILWFCVGGVKDENGARSVRASTMILCGRVATRIINDDDAIAIRGQEIVCDTYHCVLQWGVCGVKLNKLEELFLEDERDQWFTTLYCEFQSMADDACIFELFEGVDLDDLLAE